MRNRSKNVNDILARLDQSFLAPVALAAPSRYSLAVSVSCDIRCPFCPRQYYSAAERDEGFMDMDKARGLKHWLAFSNYTGLFGLGEPFLHRRFLEFAETVKKTGAYAATSTHGMSLTEAVIDQLIALEFDEVAVSLDAPTRSGFEFLRSGASFDTVLGNLQNLRSRKIIKGKTRPAVHIAVAASAHNVDRLPALTRLAHDLGAQKMIITDLIIVDPNNKNISVAGTPRMARRVNQAIQVGEKLGLPVVYFAQAPFPWSDQGDPPDQPLDKRVVRRGEPVVSCAPPVIELRDGHYGCPEIWGAVNIERNGDVKMCCYIGEKLGNAFTQDIQNIDNSPARQAIRQAMMQGQLPSPCRKCCNLREATPEYVAHTLRDVDAMAARAALTRDERVEIEQCLADYRRLFAQREGF